MKSSFHFPEVRVVEASAGSGKTYALARRYVQLLLNPALPPHQVPLRHILAITFTNKAAFEMKARILEFLRRTALDSLSAAEEENILKPIGMDRRRAAQKAFAIMEELIHNYNFFQVQTIDSFINALLCGCAFKIGLSANFKIRQNFPEYLQYSLDELIERTISDPSARRLFEVFLHQYLFLENKSGWFPKKDMLALLQALYEQGNIYGANFRPFDLKGEDLVAQKRRIYGRMQKLHAGLPEKTHQGFVRSLTAFLETNRGPFDIDRVPDYFGRTELPVQKGAEIPARVRRLWDGIRDQLRDLSEKEAYSLFNPYIAVFLQVLGQFQEKTSKDDVLFLGSLNRKARALFDEEAVTVEELYFRLATRFRHYLLDEFQDTSRLQWKNLILMIEEALSTGGSLFYVGDKKQAIFDFRGGDVKLFDQIQERFAAFNVQREVLKRNYRSRKAVVEFNNRVFSVSNLRRFLRALEERRNDDFVFGPEDLRETENVFASSQQDCLAEHGGGYVHVEIVAGANKEQRDALIRDKLLGLIKDLRRRFSYRDMAILTRSNDEIEQLTAWLAAEDISVESERTLDITENPLIGEVMAFLQFLNSPTDNAAFARFVLSEVFTKAAGLDAAQIHHFLFGLRERLGQEKDFYVYREFRARYPQAWDAFIEEFFRNVGFYPLYEFVVSIIGRLNILNNFPSQQGFIMHFLEVIKKQEEEYTDIASFLERFPELESHDLYVNVSAGDSVRIMTIHKAKGLGFPVVIMPFLDMRIRIGRGTGLGQQSYLLGLKEDHLELLRIKKKYLKFSERLLEIQRREYVRTVMTELNNIYVGLTRAQQEIYAFLPGAEGKASNIMGLLIPEDVRETGSPGTPGDAGPAPVLLSQRPLPPSRYQDWIDFLREEFSDAGRVLLRERLFLGEVIHFMLSGIGDMSDVRPADAIAGAVARARQRYPQVHSFSEHESMLEDVLARPALRMFFVVTDGELYQERDVVDAQGRTRRLDRLIVKRDEAWIIDYKSSREAESQSRAQVREYMAIVREIYPGKNIRGFLLYLDCLEVEEVFSQGV